jgi:hypothetical protein
MGRVEEIAAPEVFIPLFVQGTDTGSCRFERNFRIVEILAIGLNTSGELCKIATHVCDHQVLYFESNFAV